MITVDINVAEQMAHILECVDISMTEAFNTRSQGNYIKTTDLYDIFLDLRAVVTEYKTQHESF